LELSRETTNCTDGNMLMRISLFVSNMFYFYNIIWHSTPWWRSWPTSLLVEQKKREGCTPGVFSKSAINLSGNQSEAGFGQQLPDMQPIRGRHWSAVTNSFRFFNSAVTRAVAAPRLPMLRRVFLHWSGVNPSIKELRIILVIIIDYMWSPKWTAYVKIKFIICLGMLNDHTYNVLSQCMLTRIQAEIDEKYLPDWQAGFRSERDCRDNPPHALRPHDWKRTTNACNIHWF